MARVLSPAKFDSLHRKTSAEVIQTNMNFCNKNASPVSLLMGCILGRFQKGQSSKALPAVGIELCLEMVLRHSLSSALAAPF